MKNTLLHFVRWMLGGFLYGFIEIVWRGHTDWTMIILAMLLCIPLDIANNHIPWSFPFALQSLIGGTVIVIMEFIAGVILNVMLGLHIWDYSNLPLNLMGQICLQFYIAWIFLAGIAIILFDYIDYWFCNGKKPHYKFI